MARRQNRILVLLLVFIAISIISNIATYTQLHYSVVVSPVDAVNPPPIVATKSVHHDSLRKSSPVRDVLGANHTTGIGTAEDGNGDESICDNEKWCNYSPIPGQEKELCVPMREWQTSSYPTGNIIHEIDMIPRQSADSIEFLGSGGARIAWKVSGIVLKTMRPKKSYTDDTAEKLRYDSMVMEQRTSSPHIITLYGMTAGSQLLELAPGGELTPERVRNLSPQKKLEYAINISQAVADLHGPDNTLVHSDIWGSQIGSQLLFMADGTFKLSDFNQGFFQRWNKVRNLPCPMQGKRTNIMKKPYEEIANMPKSEKIDIYGIGVVLFFLLSTCRPYQCEPIPVNIIELKRDGIPPTLPIEITNSTIPEIASIRRVMNLAFRGDPEKRPSAQSIVNLLKGT